VTHRIETIGNATLYLGDCRDILPTLPKVDAVITDPPYNVSERNGRDGTTVGKEKRRDGSYREVRKDFGEWDRGFEPEWLMTACLPILRERGNFIAFCSDILVSDYVRGPFKHMRTMAWRKTNSPGCFNANYVPCIEWIVWCSKTAPGIYSGSRGRAPIFEYPLVHEAHREHPTQKPADLMAELLRLHTADGERVLDPFMGSGTTGVACANLGRSFIGIEREPKYFDIACRRIEDAQRQARLFT
jgi:site-specific DNA-methyltransferase (adenine-specific)